MAALFILVRERDRERECVCGGLSVRAHVCAMCVTLPV